MNWYIGQPIVAIKNHSSGDFRIGQEFKIKGLAMPPCNCVSGVVIDIGIRKPDYAGCYCPRCNARMPTLNGVMYYKEQSFAPLDVNISELTEILEREAVA